MDKSGHNARFLGIASLTPLAKGQKHRKTGQNWPQSQLPMGQFGAAEALHKGPVKHNRGVWDRVWSNRQTILVKTGKGL